ncbi:MAG: type VI secretion system tip protein VgrG [Burkholderiaceae bacterium]|nr:type VI secretion system tip protein VgrG [Burkholderiaceae bacterium]
MIRSAEIISPIQQVQLECHKISGTEGLSQLFEYEIDALCLDNQLKFNDFLGKKLTVRLHLPSGGDRFVDGHIARFAFVGQRGRYAHYRISLRPWLWFLTKSKDCRIFQNKSPVDIIKSVFKDHIGEEDFQDTLVLNDHYPAIEFCVQYRETDFDFVSRLMEHAGIYYYFKHEQGRHKLVLTDASSSHSQFVGYEKIPFLCQTNEVRADREAIRSWSMACELQPNIYAMQDYDFTAPRVNLGVSRSETNEKILPRAEIFDYPGGYRTLEEGKHCVRTRLEQIQTTCRRIEGETDARGLAVGHVFQFTAYPRAEENKEYLVLSTSIILHQAIPDSTEDELNKGSHYDCRFVVVPADEQWRPPLLTPKPVVQGPQTAVVVGAEGDEIMTDSYGRIKILFRWDRASQNGETSKDKAEESSCWVRVSHPWAGKGFGFIALPRVGQEVVVNFIDGDPDRPLVTGGVYNAEQMPPWELPAHKTRSGIVTRSTPGGDASTANELRFEDRKGAEQIYVHAQRNLDTVIENNETRDVGGDRTTDIDGNNRCTVHKNSYARVNGDLRDLYIQNMSIRFVGQGETETIKGGLKTTIEGGHTLTVKDTGQTLEVWGGIEETVKTGNVNQRILEGNYTQKVPNGICRLTASDGHELHTPQNIELQAGTRVIVNSPELVLTGGATVTGATPSESWFKGRASEVVGTVNRAVLLTTECKGISLESRGASIAGITFKGETIGIKNANEAMGKLASALEIRNVGVAMAAGALLLSQSTLTMFG